MSHEKIFWVYLKVARELHVIIIEFHAERKATPLSICDSE